MYCCSGRYVLNKVCRAVINSCDAGSTIWYLMGSFGMSLLTPISVLRAPNQGAKGTSANFLNRNRMILAFRPTFILKWCFKYNAAKLNYLIVLLLCLFAWPGHIEKILERQTHFIFWARQSGQIFLAE